MSTAAPQFYGYGTTVRPSPAHRAIWLK